MTLGRFHLLNFRSHRDLDLDFSKTNIVLGPNASGKTNLLEAIFLLSAGRSFRTNQNQDLLSFGATFCKVAGDIKEGEKRTNLEILFFIDPETGPQRVKKETRVNKKPRGLIFLLGTFLSVLFEPETLNLVLGPPSLRRRLLDMIMVQISKNYTQNLIDFLRILRQRNHLLSKIKEGKARANLLDFWDEEFLKTSRFLRKERQGLISGLNTFLPQPLRLSYLPSPSGDLEKVLGKERKKEIESGFSQFGPQKDDFIFLDKERPLASFGSRGEIREGVICLKLAEREFIKQKARSLPTLLLDDIFSELDKKRREKLVPLVLSGQTILTTTSLSLLPPNIIKTSKVIEFKG